jgi:hypothetical protein
MRKLNKHIKNRRVADRRSNPKLDGDSDTPCNDTNHSNSDSEIQNNNSSSPKLQDSNTPNKSKKQKNRKVVERPAPKVAKKKKPPSKKRKRVYKYSEDDFPSGEEKQDANVAESRKVHKKICRVQRDVVASSFDKRKLDRKQRKALSAIGGMRSRHCKDMFSSDIRLREQFGYAVIDEMEQLHSQSQLDDSLYVYHVTFLSDKFQFSVRDGTADIKGCIDKCMAVCRQHTSFNAFGVVETQVILDQTGERSGETLYTHIHAIAWTRDPDDAKRLIDRAKGYHAQLTTMPVLAQLLGSTEGDYTRVARYLCKFPYEGKKVNREALEAGRASLKSTTKGVLKYHRLRLLELLAKLPLEHSVFGVREGTAFKGRVLNRVRKWHREREGTAMALDNNDIEDLFAGILAKNKRLKNYKHLKVRHSRSQK